MAVHIDSRLVGRFGFDGISCKNADLNSQEIEIGSTPATYTLASLKKGDELVKIKYIMSAPFNGTLKLGNGSSADAYVKTGSFPKSGAGVIMIGKMITEDTDIKLEVGSGTTTGAGWFKVVWDV